MEGNCDEEHFGRFDGDCRAWFRRHWMQVFRDMRFWNMQFSEGPNTVELNLRDYADVRPELRIGRGVRFRLASNANFSGLRFAISL